MEFYRNEKSSFLNDDTEIKIIFSERHHLDMGIRNLRFFRYYENIRSLI